MDGPDDADQMHVVLERRSHLVLAFTRALDANGAGTERVMAAAERLGRPLGVRARAIAPWRGLQLRAEDRSARFDARAAADPIGIEMDRVAAVAGAIVGVEAGRLAAS